MGPIDLGRDIFTKIKSELWPVSKVERDAKMEGRRMTLVLQPDHKPAGAKPPVPGGKAPPRAGSSMNIPPRPAAGAPGAAAPRPVGAPAPAAPRPAAAPAPAAPRPATATATAAPEPAPVSR